MYPSLTHSPPALSQPPLFYSRFSLINFTRHHRVLQKIRILLKAPLTSGWRAGELNDEEENGKKINTTRRNMYTFCRIQEWLWGWERIVVVRHNLTAAHQSSVPRKTWRTNNTARVLSLREWEWWWCWCIYFSDGSRIHSRISLENSIIVLCLNFRQTKREMIENKSETDTIEWEEFQTNNKVL